MCALKGFLMSSGAVLPVFTGSSGVEAACTSARCPTMPGLIVAANSSVEVSRSQVAHAPGRGRGRAHARAMVRLIPVPGE